MKILVTGGAGYIGSTISNYFLDKGHEVEIIDNLSTGLVKNIPKKSVFYKIDISNVKKLDKIFKKKKFDIVFHLAALISNEESIKYPKKYYYNNYLKSKIFLKQCIKNNINNFVYSSTAAVYGNKDKPISENDFLRPLSPYSKSKLRLENLFKKEKKKISCIILRYFNVAGSDLKLRCGFNVKKSHNLILNLCAASIKKKKFVINGDNYNTKDGTTIRDYIHVQDLAHIHLLAANLILKKKVFKILNCGYGQGFSIKEILTTFNSILKKDIEYRVGKKRPRDIKISISNPNKLIKTIKWKPKYNNLSDLLNSSLRWYKKISTV